MTLDEFHADTTWNPDGAPRPIGMECCHLDDDPTNNHLSNLRWDTRSANSFESYLEEAPSVEALTCDLPVMDISIFEIHGGVTDERHGLRS